MNYRINDELPEANSYDVEACNAEAEDVDSYDVEAYDAEAEDVDSYDVEAYDAEAEEVDSYDAEARDAEAEEISVNAKVVDIVDNTCKYNIAVKTASGTAEFNTNDMDRPALTSMLVQHGMSPFVDRTEQCDFIKELLLSAIKAPITYVHRLLGLIRIFKKPAFFLYHPVGIKGKKKGSRYDGQYDVKPKGDLTAYKDLLNREVVGHTPLELALSMAITAPLVTTLRMLDGEDYDLPIFTLVGPSSTGKTTALRLVLSVFGNPTDQGNLMGNFNATDQALSERFSEMRGLPLVLDDATNTKIDFSRRVLEWSTGKGRERLNSTGKIQNRARFEGAFLISSEKSLLTDKCNSSGASARVVEFNMTWTDSAKHAMRLNKALSKTYGTLAKPIVECLLENHVRIAQSVRKEYTNLQKDGLFGNEVEERRLKAYALVIVAARLIKKVENLDLNINALRTLLKEQYQMHSSASQDEAEVVINEFHAYLAEHNAKFFHNRKAAYSGTLFPGSLIGEIIMENGRPTKVWITKKSFEDFLINNCHYGENDLTYIRKLLVEKKFLIQDSQRHYTVAHAIGPARPLCYNILLN